MWRNGFTKKLSETSKFVAEAISKLVAIFQIDSKVCQKFSYLLCLFYTFNTKTVAKYPCIYIKIN